MVVVSSLGCGCLRLERAGEQRLRKVRVVLVAPRVVPDELMRYRCCHWRQGWIQTLVPLLDCPMTLGREAVMVHRPAHAKRGGESSAYQVDPPS